MAVLVMVMGLPMSAGAACAHENTYHYLVQPVTCCQDGIYDLRCKDCGAKLQKNVATVGATGDHPGTDVEVTNPRCLTDGEARFYCTLSGKLVKTEVIDKLGHKMTSIGVDDATCTEEGVIHLRCIRCRQESTATGAPALGHQMKKIGMVPAGCDTEGNETLACQRPGCDHTVINTIPAHGHKMVNVSVSEPTCTTGGCVKMACAYCGLETETLGAKPLGHSYNLMSNTAATCEVAGISIKICGVCGYEDIVEIAPLGHDMKLVAEVLGDCEADGQETYECQRYGCDHSYTLPVKAPGHSYNMMSNTAATCEVAGKSVKTCGVCGYEEIVETAPLGHDMKLVAEVLGDCETDGLKTYECQRYGCDHSKDEVVPAPGHFTAAEVKPATCTEPGYYRESCSFCDFEEEIVYKPYHVLRNVGMVKEPTCEEEGVATIACMNCSLSFNITLPARGHDMGVAEDVCSTCVKQGYYKAQCTRCDFKEHILYTLVPHTWIESISSSSESRFVYYHKECSVCGASNVIRYRK